MPAIRWRVRLFQAAALLAAVALSGGDAARAQETQPPARVIDISSAGPAGNGGAHLVLGDLVGNGRFELLLIQPDIMEDDRFIGHQINSLTAFDLDGKQLWQVGDPANGRGAGADIPAQIFDFDADGLNDVLACMNNDVVKEKFAVLDGRTGAVKQTLDYPSPNAHDTIIIANFTGAPTPRNIILKDRYRNLWAMDAQWNQAFRFSGNIGHYPWPSDYDHDGREELMASFDFIDETGKSLWQASQTGHADCVWVGDIDQNPANGREIAIGGDDLTVYDHTGKLLWRRDEPVEPQYLAIGDFRPDLPGLEIAGHDRVDRGRPGRQATFLVSSTGEMLWYKDRTGWLDLIYLVHNWRGPGDDLIACWGRDPAITGLYDGRFEKVAGFENGYLQVADLDGDGTDEVISYGGGKARIYSGTPIDFNAAITGQPRPQKKREYNYTRYWGGEYPPR